MQPWEHQALPGKQANINLPHSFAFFPSHPATVREIKVLFRLYSSLKVPMPPPSFSEPPQEHGALVLMIQKVRIKEATDSFEVTRKECQIPIWVLLTHPLAYSP